jgi:PHD/YefM family antitoxin component YafN of YafNO toxin-antitoxin module
MATLSITDARKAFLDLPEQLAKDPEHALSVTRHGAPVLAVLPWELYESLVETLEALGDPDLMAVFRASLKDVAKGRLLSHQEVKRRLGV